MLKYTKLGAGNQQRLALRETKAQALNSAAGRLKKSYRHLWSTGHDIGVTRYRAPVRSWPGVLRVFGDKAFVRLLQGSYKAVGRVLKEF